MLAAFARESGGIFWATLVAGVAGLLFGKAFKFAKDRWNQTGCLNKLPQPSESVGPTCSLVIAFLYPPSGPTDIMSPWKLSWCITTMIIACGFALVLYTDARA